jgi:sulfite reductase alpha subunit-like flavoprotein
MPEQSQGCRYVQNCILHDSNAVLELLKVGARILVCVPGCAVEEVGGTLNDVSSDFRTQQATLIEHC